MHLLGPIAQAVHHELQHARMVEVQRVAGAGRVEIHALVVGETVIGRVVDAAERQRRPEVIALAGMVVDDVEQHLDAGIVQSLHRDLEIGEERVREIARLRREEADGVVAPVIPKPALHEPAVVDEGLDRQKLDRGDAERHEVVDHRRRDEAGERAAPLGIDAGMSHRHAAHMRLEHDRLFPWHVRAAVVAPGEGGIDDAAFRHEAGAVAPVEGQVLALAPRADAVAVMRIVPPDRALKRFRVRVEQQLVGVEAVSVLRAVGAVDAIAVKQIGPRVRQIAVPHLVGIFGEPDARASRAARSYRTGTIRPPRHFPRTARN